MPVSRVQKLKESDRLKTYGKVTVPDSYSGGPPLQPRKRLLRPEVGLGSSVDVYDEYINYKIAAIIIGVLTVAILSTIAYEEYEKLDDANKHTRILISYISGISWTVLVIFMFLIFNASRLLNIVIFIFILILSTIAFNRTYSQGGDTKSVQGLLIAIISLASLIILVLAYYAMTSLKEQEILEIRTQERIRKQNEEIKNLIDKVKEDTKIKFAEDYNQQKAKQLEIADKAIETFLSGRIRPDKSGGGKQKSGGN